MNEEYARNALCYNQISCQDSGQQYSEAKLGPLSAAAVIYQFAICLFFDANSRFSPLRDVLCRDARINLGYIEITNHLFGFLASCSDKQRYDLLP